MVVQLPTSSELCLNQSLKEVLGFLWNLRLTWIITIFMYIVMLVLFVHVL